MGRITGRLQTRRQARELGAERRELLLRYAGRDGIRAAMGDRSLDVRTVRLFTAVAKAGE